MTDREMLELAAKAAGLTVLRYEPGYGLAIEGKGRWWNPLDEDGDALRLANKLRINIYNGSAESVVCGRCGITGFRVAVQSDADAATRRAIVLAAAEIGKSMP